MTDREENSDARFERPTGWISKFRCAFNGLWYGLRTQSSFLVHLPAALVVILLAWQLGLSVIELALLLFCVALVLVLEFVNTALESMAKSITQEYDPHIRQALDVSAAAVLVAAMFSVAIGVVIFLPKLLGA